MANPQEVGARAEDRVARDLKRHGAGVERSPGSRGAADMKAKLGSRKWHVQVKASGVGAPDWPSSEELRRLKISATLAGATPVVALVDKSGQLSYHSARSRRQLHP